MTSESNASIDGTRRSLIRAVCAGGLAVAVAGCPDDGPADEGAANGGAEGGGAENDEGAENETGAEDDQEDDGAGADDEGEVESRRFEAQLSDDSDMPGHEESDSEGTGETQLEETDAGEAVAFTIEYQDLEGEVNGIHVHGDGAADGGYLVRLFESEDSEHADAAVVTDDLLSAEEDSVEGTIHDEHVNPDGDYDDEVENVMDLLNYLEIFVVDESGGFVNIHTEHDPDGEIAGAVVSA